MIRCLLFSMLIHSLVAMGLLGLALTSPPMPKVRPMIKMNLTDLRPAAGMIAAPISTPAPAPTPATTPRATPVATPRATATPTPAPTARPTPEATPTPRPTPAPTPETKATPKPTPTPKPDPTPEPKLTPVPERKTKAEPEPTATPTVKKSAEKPKEAVKDAKKKDIVDEPAPKPTATPVATPAATPPPAPVLPPSVDLSGVQQPVIPGVPAAATVTRGGVSAGTASAEDFSQTYFAIVIQKIKENFRHPLQNSNLTCVITFVIQRDGTITNIQVVRDRGTGNATIDQYALNAVRATAKLPPLWDGFRKNFLQITMTFDYNRETQLP